MRVGGHHVESVFGGPALAAAVSTARAGEAPRQRLANTPTCACALTAWSPCRSTGTAPRRRRRLRCRRKPRCAGRARQGRGTTGPGKAVPRHLAPEGNLRRKQKGTMARAVRRASRDRQLGTVSPHRHTPIDSSMHSRSASRPGSRKRIVNVVLATHCLPVNVWV